MSPYDVTKTGAAHPVRATSRELGGSRTERRPDTGGAAVDKGVSVQTGGRVSAGSVPVDDNRVAQIREALREGSYPIVPARIADAMIAARLLLSGDR